MMRQPITPLAEAGTRNDQLIVVVLSVLKVKGFCDLVRQMTGWSLSGSNSSRLARPSIVASDWLLTCVVKVTSSPWRRKRGRAGVTISGLLVMISRDR